jgi:hypothetical protein
MKILDNTKILIAILFLVSIILYALTFNPNVTFTDNGELASAAIKLGISHPTGYPLFTLLGFVWSLLPIMSSKIAQMNFLSSIFVATSSIFLFLTVRVLIANFIYFENVKNSNKKKSNTDRISKKLSLENWQINTISLITSFTYITALTIWEQALFFEVYSLQLLLVNLFFYFILKAYFADALQDNKTHQLNRFWLISTFILGLLLTNHLIAIWLIPSFVWIMLRNSQDKFNFSKLTTKNILTIIIIGTITLFLYAYLPIRSAMLPEINWGWVHRSFDKFLYHLSGKQYQVWMFSDSSVAIDNLGEFFALLPKQFGYIGLFVLIFGLIILVKNKTIFFFILAVLAFNILYAMNYSIFDIETYFVTSYTILMLVLSLGFVWIIQKQPKIIFLGLLIPILNLSINIAHTNKSEDALVKEYAYNLADNVEQNAIIFSSQWDFFVGPFIYLQNVENYRKDIVIFETELVRRTWYPKQFAKTHPEIYNQSKSQFIEYEQILELFESDKPYNRNEIQQHYVNLQKSIIDNYINQRPIYATLETYANNLDIFNNYKVVPFGFALRVLPLNSPEINLSKMKLDLSKLITLKDKYDGELPTALMGLITENLKNVNMYANSTNQRQIGEWAAQQSSYFTPKRK